MDTTEYRIGFEDACDTIAEMLRREGRGEAAEEVQTFALQMHKAKADAILRNMEFDRVFSTVPARKVFLPPKRPRAKGK